MADLQSPRPTAPPSVATYSGVGSPSVATYGVVVGTHDVVVPQHPPVFDAMEWRMTVPGVGKLRTDIAKNGSTDPIRRQKLKALSRHLSHAGYYNRKNSEQTEHKAKLDNIRAKQKERKFREEHPEIPRAPPMGPLLPPAAPRALERSVVEGRKMELRDQNVQQRQKSRCAAGAVRRTPKAKLASAGRKAATRSKPRVVQQPASSHIVKS